MLVIGAGGLGSAVVPALAGGRRRHHRHRRRRRGRGVQPAAADAVHGARDIGRPKVDSAAETVARDRPRDATSGRTRCARRRANLPELLSRLRPADRRQRQLPDPLSRQRRGRAGRRSRWCGVSILRFHGQVGVAWHGRGPTTATSSPCRPRRTRLLSCELGGVLPTLCTAVGSLMATEAIKLVTGHRRAAPRPRARSRRAHRPHPRDRLRRLGRDPRDHGAHRLRAVLRGGRRRATSRPSPRPTSCGRLRAGDGMRLLDVREPHEARARRIPGQRS